MPQTNDQDRRASDPLAHHKRLRRTQHTEFIIALGCRGEIIKDHFPTLYAFNNDMTVPLAGSAVKIHDANRPKWKMHLIDAGLTANNGKESARRDVELGPRPVKNLETSANGTG